MTNRWKIECVSIEDIDFLEKNARFMGREMFNQLAENISKNKEVTSVPLCIKEENGRYTVISGNHRVKAAKIAGIVKLHIMYCDHSEITKDERLALQISHNSIGGEDDERILKELLEEISSLDYKEFSYIDEKALAEINSVKFDMLNPSNEVIVYTFAFFDENAHSFEMLKARIEELSESELKHLDIVPYQSIDKFNEVMSKVQEVYKVKSAGIAITKMVELAGMKLREELE